MLHSIKVFHKVFMAGVNMKPFIDALCRLSPSCCQDFLWVARGCRGPSEEAVSVPGVAQWAGVGGSHQPHMVAAGDAAPEGERGHDGHDPHLPCCPG